MKARLRLLPTLMVCAAALCAVKVAGMSEHAERFLPGFAPAYAQEAAAAEDAEAAAPEDAAGEAGETADAAPDGEAAAEAGNADVQMMGKAPPSAKEEVLQKLSQRRSEIEAFARELEMRERLVEAAERRVNERFKELEEVEEKIAAHFGKQDEETKMRVEGLVKMYSAMKPKDAARIFERLDMDVLLQLAEAMNERKMAAILAEMDPVTAQELTLEIALPRPLPGDLQDVAARFSAKAEDGEGEVAN
ncbi:MotE family protein [Tepidicaulis sp. LMO-SS28]|uniref:MotE family protein n=1 Tax=Tepidicaulis sp. LMO-SS28 TaxID=3447455 RepID=UPI003EE0C9F2